MIIVPHIVVMAKTEGGTITMRNVVEGEVAVQVTILAENDGGLTRLTRETDLNLGLDMAMITTPIQEHMDIPHRGPRTGAIIHFNSIRLP